MKRILFFLLFTVFEVSGYACTVCGCSASNQYLGILPQFHKHFAGLQYQYRGFKSEHLSHEVNEPASFSREDFTTIQAWGRLNVGKHLQLFGFVPYIFNIRNEGGQRTSVSGLGDITLLGNVRLLGLKENANIWKHSLQLGGGVKLPTGAYDKASIARADGLPNMQPGTNSTDFIANANYTVRRKAVGVNADVSYTMTTTNSLQYKYGNRISAGVLGFYWYQKNQLTVLPQAGLRLDIAGADYDNYQYRWKNDMSGGNQLYASVGAQLYYRRLGYQVMYHQPLSQHYANGLVKATFKTETGVYILF